MSRLYFDIETVPAPAELHPILREVYDAKMAKGKQRGKPVTESFEDFAAATGLAGEFGRIVCLAYGIDDQPVEVLWGEELEILTSFWKISASTKQFIGHNVFGFDFPFIMKRSRILGVQPSQELNFARYRQFPIYDTMQEWDLWNPRNSTSLDTLAKALSLPTSKDAMDGSQVAEYYAAGRIEEICEYCQKDVELTRRVHQRMTFQKAGT